MSEQAAGNVQEPQASRRFGPYLVVARRYRPQCFDDLVGQEHIARALSNAISNQRVGHAYLFTGARGVGKTSTARILAKALNCESGPTPTPCNRCEFCVSIASGEDVDVLEIDGASNRGIDEIRQLRQNVTVRPSRARYKIYIIDEVHMLTREAFNALLKTLEEPPGHVKFIFCTTEPAKIPPTILSRCQRFDFAAIRTPSIVQRLGQIAQAEKVQADPQALEIIARRAAGSMRDAQSLLEQLLAFAPERISAADVHQMLGAAADQQVARLGELLAAGDASGVLAEIDAACREGVDLGLLIEQLCGFFRDAMVASAGCGAESFAYTGSQSADKVAEVAAQLPLANLLAAIQILDQTLWRLRTSTHGRILVELALVRIARLENLEELAALIGRLEGGDGGSAVSAPKAGVGRKEQPAPRQHNPAQPRTEAHAATAAPTDDRPRKEQEATLGRASEAAIGSSNSSPEQLWEKVLEEVGGIVAAYGKEYVAAAISAPNRLVVTLRAGYTLAKSFCEQPEQLAKLERTASRILGTAAKIEFQMATGGVGPGPPVGKRSQQRLLREVAAHPMVQQASELFGALPTKVKPPDRPPGEDRQ